MQTFTKLYLQARARQHAVQQVCENLDEHYAFGPCMTGACLDRPVGIKHENLCIPTLEAVAIANKIIDARLQFFNDIKLPTKTRIYGRAKKEVGIIFLCLLCGDTDCPNADIGICYTEE